MEEQPHSGLGIASFILSIVSGVLIFLLVVVAGVIEATTPGGMDEESAVAVMVGLCLFALLFVSLVALVLGIAGLVQQDRKKIFAILGTVFSAVTILGTIGIVIVGLTMS